MFTPFGIYTSFCLVFLGVFENDYDNLWNLAVGSFQVSWRIYKVHLGVSIISKSTTNFSFWLNTI